MILAGAHNSRLLFFYILYLGGAHIIMANRLLKKLKAFDRSVGYPLSQIRELYNLSKLQAGYEKYKDLRRLECNDDQCTEASDELRNNGYVVLRSFLSGDLMDELTRELNSNIDRLNVSKVIDMRDREIGDFPEYLDDFDLREGQESFRYKTNYVSVSQPMLASKNVVKVVFNEQILRIANHYLGCYAAVGSVNWRKSYANEFPPMDNQMYHTDKNCVVPLKVLVYLNDVDIDGGPFVYVKGSNTRKFSGWLKSHRYTDGAIGLKYEKDHIMNLVGQKGDVVIADTSGIHKGLHPKNTDRYILITSLNAQPEFSGKRGGFRLTKECYDSLTKTQKRAADFLAID